jgi:hypothetical protein
MATVVEIVTERLRLRPFRADDLAAFVAYRSEREVARSPSCSRSTASIASTHRPTTATWPSTLLERVGLRCEARLVEADWFKEEWSTLRVFAVLRREGGAATTDDSGARSRS